MLEAKRKPAVRSVEGEQTMGLQDNISSAVETAKEKAADLAAKGREAVEGAVEKAQDLAAKGSEAAQGAVEKAKEAAQNLKPGQ
jgi:hypothetical protein